jgi:hypothetical protein
MRVKVLRDKDTKEFIHFAQFGIKTLVCTSGIPNVHPMSATLGLMKEIYPKEKFLDSFDSLDNFELVEFDLIEAGEVGADIRNKLTPYNNLVALVELFLDEENIVKKKKLKKFIRKEIVQSKKSVKYLAGLL